MEMEIINQICTVCLIPVYENGKDESLSKQLSIVYLVHTLLEVPLDECTQYLEKYGNPNNWVTLCTSCSCVVQEAKEINRKILELEDELECLKKKILLPMQVKVNEENASGYKTDETAAYMIRKFVYTNTRTEAIDDYFISEKTFKRGFSRRKRINDTSRLGGTKTKYCKPPVHAPTIKLTGIELEESLKEGETWKCPICDDRKYTKKRTWRDHIRRKHRTFLLHLDDKITDDHVCLVGQCVSDSSTNFSTNDTTIIQIGKSDSDLEQDQQNEKNNTMNRPRRSATLRFRQKYPGTNGSQSNAVKGSLSDSENDSVQNYSDYTPTFSDRQSDSDEEYVLPQNNVKRPSRSDDSVQGSSWENDNCSASPFGMIEPIAKKFSCNFCEKAYSHDRSLRKHVRVAHGIEYKKNFGQENDSDEEHVFPQNDVKRSTRNDDSAQESSCENDNNSASPFGMNEPIAKKFSCNFCEKAYSHDRSLRKHVRVAHEIEHKKNLGQENDSDEEHVFQQNDVKRSTRNDDSAQESSCENDNNSASPFGMNEPIAKKFSCNFCEKAYSHDRSLRKHVRVAHGIEHKNFGQENDCDEEHVFPQNNVKRSTRIDDSIQGSSCENDNCSASPFGMIDPIAKKFSCNFCEKAYSHDRSLRKHMRVAHEIEHKKNLGQENDGKELQSKEKNLSCHICSSKFRKQDSLFAHIRLKHGIRKIRRGAVRENKDWETIIKQREEKLNILMNSNKETKKRKNERNKLHLHVLAKQNNIKKFPCKDCNDTFTAFKDWQVHINKTHKTGFRCHLCEKVVAKQINLENHIRAVHHPVSILVCSGCNKTFKKSDFFNEHLKSNPDCKAKAFPCTMCKYLFGTKECLDIHNEIRHISQPPAPYSCSKCPNKTFNHKVGLKVHMEMCHSKINKVVCDKCGVEFSHTRLKAHQRAVHGSRKYPCPVCKKVFKNTSGLSRHKQIHQEESPHLCSICGKGFKIFNYLTIHMWSHDPDRKEKYSSYKPKTKNKAPKKRSIKNRVNSDNDSMETFYENTEELNQSNAHTPKQSSEQELNAHSSQQQLSEINVTRVSTAVNLDSAGQKILSQIPDQSQYFSYIGF